MSNRFDEIEKVIKETLQINICQCGRPKVFKALQCSFCRYAKVSTSYILLQCPVCMDQFYCHASLIQKGHRRFNYCSKACSYKLIGIAQISTKLQQNFDQVAINIASGLKWCWRGKHWVDYKHFYRDRMSTDGLCEQCIDCNRISRRKYNRADPEGKKWYRAQSPDLKADYLRALVAVGKFNDAAKMIYVDKGVIVRRRKKDQVFNLNVYRAAIQYMQEHHYSYQKLSGVLWRKCRGNAGLYAKLIGELQMPSRKSAPGRKYTFRPAPTTDFRH